MTDRQTNRQDNYYNPLVHAQTTVSPCYLHLQWALIGRASRDDDPELLAFPDFFLLHAGGCSMQSSSLSGKAIIIIIIIIIIIVLIITISPHYLHLQ